MSTQHTPGPWRTANGGDVFTALGATTADGWKAADNDGWHIADCRPGTLTIDDIGHDCELSSDEVLANARLISAAPDMYEALKSLIQDCETANARWVDQVGIGAIDINVLSRARTALEKAEGKS